MKFLYLAAILTLVLSCLLPSVSAHAFGSFNQLPIPVYLYYFGAATAVAISFILVSFFIKRSHSQTEYRTYNLLSHSYVGKILQSGYLAAAPKLVSAILVLLVVLTGILGNQITVFNFAPTFVWIIWWVGSAFGHVLIGNLWQLANPWKAILKWLTADFKPIFTYPRKLGVFPAFLGFFGFMWIELIFPNPSLPRVVATLTVAYSMVTWVGMGLFGSNVWLRYCDPFSLFFHYLSKLAPTEVRVTNASMCKSCPLDCQNSENDCVNCYECFERADKHERQVNLRPFGAGLLRPDSMSIDRVCFIVLMLAGVSFDGLSQTLAWHSLVGVDPLATRTSLLGINTIGLVGVFAVFLAVYLTIIWLARIAAGSDLSMRSVAFRLAVSLLPIAMVYQLAHYSTYLFVNGQQIIRLASDPFGYGWNLFGTANFPVSTNLNFLVIWNYQVSLIVVGHVIAVYVAHRLALNLFPSIRTAVRSQYPMIMLMIAYTSAGLWLLSARGVG